MSVLQHGTTKFPMNLPAFPSVIPRFELRASLFPRTRTRRVPISAMQSLMYRRFMMMARGRRTQTAYPSKDQRHSRHCKVTLMGGLVSDSGEWLAEATRFLWRGAFMTDSFALFIPSTALLLRIIINALIIIIICLLSTRTYLFLLLLRVWKMKISNLL